jgi:hypothetical protein
MNRATRNRSIIVTAALACAAVMAPAVALAASAAPAAPRAAAVPHCGASSIEVWLGLNPDGATAGTTYYPIEFTNDGVGTHTCYLSGKPTIFAVNSQGHRIGPVLHGSTSGKKITLKPGQTAYVRLGIVQAGFISGCGQTTGVGLQITPPGQSASQPIYDFSFPACKNKPYLHENSLVAGVGIP